MPLGAHAVDHGTHDLARHALGQRLVRQRTRRERAHPSRVRPAVVVEDALVILRRADRHRALAVGEHEERHLRAGEALFEHNARAGRAETAEAHHVADRRLGFPEI